MQINVYLSATRSVFNGNSVNSHADQHVSLQPDKSSMGTVDSHADRYDCVSLQPDQSSVGTVDSQSSISLQWEFSE